MLYILAFLWITIGFGTNVYYLMINSKHYEDMLNSGEIKPINLFVGVFLTFFLWPVSIYNNEYRQK